jgi:hypothetical protein
MSVMSKGDKLILLGHNFADARNKTGVEGTKKIYCSFELIIILLSDDLLQQFKNNLLMKKLTNLCR